MTDEADTTTTHWAVLIGIDYYPKDRCLKGSVRDAETVKQYLEAGPIPVDIVILTATTPSDPSSSGPIEKPDLWPTYKNVIKSLKRVLEKAKQGDVVYIHYSGHGTRRNESAGDTYEKSGNLAFVLFEDNEHGSSYLRGQVLANCLHKIVTQGLLVTLVLDCCYSGSVLRGNGQRGVDVRAVDYDPVIDAASPHELDTDSSNSDGTLRNSQMPDQWLVKPDGYTIPSACSPHEKAWELEIEGERRGALTYFLIEALSALRKSGVELTHQSLYQHLRTRFHASWPQQTPMRYGNKNFSFFGKLAIVSDTVFVPVYRDDDDRMCLSAGEAHGVYKGDEYAVYPFDSSEAVTDQTNEEPVIVRVDTVRCLTSDLVEIEGTPAAKQVKTGWKAKALTCFSPRKICVRLMASIGSQIQCEEAAKQQRFLHLSTENETTEPCIFNVTLNEHREYEILDGSHERITSLPTIPLDTNGALSGVVDILQHLATFKYFEGVENRSPSASFESSFSLCPDCAAGTSGNFNVKHGNTWGFTVENFSDKPLYMAIFNFTPSWQILNLVSHSGGGDFLVVPPKEEEEGNGEVKIPLQMEVPEFLRSRGQNQCEDIVKIFLTSKPTSFPSMVLPEMPLHAEGLCGRVRGGGDQLPNFLSQLTARFRSRRNALHEEWASRNFIIRTIAE
ncbi:hypothetical protein DL769_011426 [Monosporascus sp. CRB-8-3]|nr:hypothetical protein DL769_011426 [Monosporascus sp. CRB-8-3]